MKILIKREAFIEARIKAGYSQRGLSKKIGSSSAYVSQIEKGDRNPSPCAAKKLCVALQKAFEDIFFIDSGNNSNHNYDICNLVINQ